MTTVATNLGPAIRVRDGPLVPICLPDYTNAMSKQSPRSAHNRTLLSSVFVGRRWEIAVLSASLKDAQAGQGRFAMLVGEPGIGKTSTAKEFTDFAASQGARVL